MSNITLHVKDIDICLILFNEEGFIGDCLQALKPYFGRVVVLDMGSEDRTVEIVREVYGEAATILSQPRSELLRKGFAHARNVVTEAATGPWVLHVDADEILAPLQGEILTFPDTSLQGGAVARVVRRNLVGKAPPAFRPELLAHYATRSIEQHVRLYRRAPEVRWESFLHEEIWIGAVPAHERAGTAPLTLEHVSGFKPFSALDEKEDFYAWILVRVRDHSELQTHMREYYRQEFFSQHEQRFRAMARRYAQRHRLEDFQ